ncbi:hypothetical protein [Mycolicibacterium alvei]|uniref:hypothetical protein n=1 Tax=Mycolicibacterium alvei TaxID=67081 RepID=UPI0013D4BBF7|nr:hypothetical protein [Mycolicibacterium alvei]MCV6999584.1 hypothetical protein [Mycolicibacterium alvei]
MRQNNWIDRAIGWCFGILLGVITLTCAVQLITAMLPALVIIIGLAGLVYVGSVVISTLRNRW